MGRFTRHPPFSQGSLHKLREELSPTLHLDPTLVTVQALQILRHKNLGLCPIYA